jgi:intein-encoded DNA endonuclease-like protein
VYCDNITAKEIKMKLRDWLNENRYSYAKLSKAIEAETGYVISPATFNSWCLGKSQPNLKSWRLTVEFTGGKVTEPN